MIEILVAIAIFAFASLYLLERRNSSIEASHYAIQLLKAQGIVDDVLQKYRLYPFSVDPLEIDVEQYKPFIVTHSVQRETINILPEDWRVELDYDVYDPEQRKLHRLILRVAVDVAFGSMEHPEPDYYTYGVSTLIRHKELLKTEGGTAK